MSLDVHLNMSQSGNGLIPDHGKLRGNYTGERLTDGGSSPADPHPKGKRRASTRPQDRALVRSLVEAVGPREAARQLEIAPGTVLSWCKRYGWSKSTRPAPLSPLQSKCNHAPDVLNNYSKTTKLGLAKAAAKAAEHFAEMPSSKLVRPDAITAAKNWTQTGEIVFGWKQEQPASGIVSPLTVYSRQTVIGISDSLGKQPQE